MRTCIYILILILPAVVAKAQSSAGIQGTWKCTRTTTHYYSQTNPMLAPDADEYQVAYHFNLHVVNDSVFMYEYPCFYVGKASFFIHGDSLYYKANAKAYGAITVKKNEVAISSLDAGWEIWERDTLPLAELAQLKKDSVNYGCLAGNYKLVTYYMPPDAEAYEEHFPIDLPVYVQLKDKQAVKALAGTHEIYLQTGSGKRLFKVDELRWNNNHARRAMPSPGFILYPGDWWKGGRFSVQYIYTAEKLTQSELSKMHKASFRQE